MGTVLFAQGNEAELKSQAEKSYRNDNFVEASKLYSQLLAFNTTDPFYNYRYGVCLLYNSRKKQDAIKHLTYASKAENFDPEVFYYLGKAYHLNYEFGEAIRNYKLYQSKSGSKINLSLDVNHQIEMSENGKRLLSSMNEMVVLEKKEIENASFFRIYDLKNIGGEMIVTAQFQSKVDKKKNHTPVIHFPAKPNTIFYSSYGEDEKNGKDIFIRRRLPDGSWSLPQTVNGEVNTKYDEEYPYMHPDGIHLYFCSKGHNSMGGYDVFRSTYDKENNTFSKAENLDFAISSPDDDLFYVVDSLNKYACFASRRQSQDGKIHVYKVRVDQVPLQLAVVKAAFSSTINPANKKVTVEVYDFASNTKVGTFNSTEKGSVLITFPKGGKYEYQITVDGVNTLFKSVVTIPFLTEFKPLKQKLLHENGETGETVKVVNLFDENVEDPVATMTEIAKIRSELNPNSEQFDLNVLDKGVANKEVYAQIGMGKLSDREVQEGIEKLAQNKEKQTENLISLQQKAIDQTILNIKTIGELQPELKKTIALADSKQGSEKRELVEKAAGIVNELNRLQSESKKLLTFSDSLTASVKAKDEADDKARKLSDEIEKAYQKNDLSQMAKLISDNKTQIQDLQKENTSLATEQLVKDIVAKREEIKKIEANQKEYLDSKIKLKQELMDLEVKLLEARTKDQEAISKKMDDKTKELKMVEDELKNVEKKIIAKKEEQAKMESTLAYLQDVQNSKAPATNSTSDQASKELIASDNQNTRTLKAYVEQQSKEMGIDMYAVKSVAKTQSSGNPVASKEISAQEKTVIAKLAPDYETNLKEIANDPDLSEEQKLKTIQRQDKDLKFQLAKEINRIETELAKNPNDAGLKKELDGLNSLKETLSGRIENKQVELTAKYPETNPPVKMTEAQMTNQIKPHHIALLLTIDNDDALTENQRMDKAQTEDQKFMLLLSKEKARLDDEFSKKPDDEKIKHELFLVKNLIAQTEDRIEKRTMGMSAFNITDTKTPETYVPKTTENKVDENLVADNKTPENKAVDNKTPENKAVDNKTPENKIVDNKTPENKTVDNKTPENKVEDNKTPENKLVDNKTPENKIIDNKTPENKIEDNKTPENKLVDDKTPENKIEDNKTPENKLTPSTNTPTISPVLVKADYQTKTDAIRQNQSLSEKDKELRLISEEKNLQWAVKNKLIAVDKKLQKTPSDTALIREKTQLMTIKSESESRIDESSQLVISEEKKAINKPDLIKKTDLSYEKEIKALQEKSAGTPSPELIAREEKLQKALQAKITSNKQKTSGKEDLKLTAENQVLAELIEDSKNRAAGTPTSSEIAGDPMSVKLRNENLNSDAPLMTQDFTSLPELKNQEKVLSEYQTKLEKLTQENQQKLGSDPGNKELLSEQKAISGELEALKSKLRKVRISIGELEQQTVSAELSSGVVQNKELLDLKTQESALEAKLSDPKTPKKDLKKVATELVANKEKQAGIEGTEISAKVTQIRQNPPNQKSSSVSPTDQAIHSRDSLQYVNLLRSQEQIEGDLAKARKAKRPDQKIELLDEVQSKQAKNEQISRDLLYDSQLTKDLAAIKSENPQANVLTLESKSNLEKRKYRVSVSIGELESEIQNDQASLKTAKSADDKKELQDGIKAKEKELQLLKNEQKIIVEELALRDREEKAISSKETVPVFVSEEEKASLTSSPSYPELKTAYESKKTSEAELKTAYQDLERSKENYNKAVQELAQSPTPANQQKAGDAAKELKAKQTAFTQAKNTNEANNKSYQEKSKAITDLAKMEQLFSDGVESNFKPVSSKPLTSRPVSADVVAFRILETPQTVPVKERVTIGKPLPMGLVYRVQVGAFARPLKTSLFSEFTPVTGEKFKAGITRYITGYFNSIINASDARKQIQNLGYRDAFIVAYCDGKRITIAEAKRLEASGDCVPKAENELLNIIANQQGGNSSETASEENKSVKEEKTPVDKKVVKSDVKEKQLPVDVSVGDYNKGPGAVKAIAVETKPGLFYTVQVGAYVTPATPKQLKYIENIVSKKLADGKIRYSTGIFSSVSAASSTKNMAISKGIRDAFVTAYYKGERITLAEAAKLLKENGNSILETNNPNESSGVSSTTVEKADPVVEVLPEPVVLIEKPKKTEQYLQFVSKKSFQEYPRDELKRYNENGMYFYDQKDKKVKSVVYKDQKMSANVYYYKGELDSVFIVPADYELNLSSGIRITASKKSSSIDGAFMDWLIRLPYQREIIQKAGEISISLVQIDSESKKAELQKQLAAFGFN